MNQYKIDRALAFLKENVIKHLIVGLFLLSYSMASFAKAGFLMEPSFTFEQNGDDRKPGDLSGFGTGIRLALNFNSLFVGFDGRYSMPTFNQPSTDQDVTSKSYNWGPVVGIGHPSGIRMWGSAILGAELDPGKDAGIDQKFMNGDGVRFGAGFGGKKVSMNLEYQIVRYRQRSLEQNHTKSTMKETYQQDSIILSLSFPINF